MLDSRRRPTAFFASPAPLALIVRFWAFQGTMATNIAHRRRSTGRPSTASSALAAQAPRLPDPGDLRSQAGTCDGGHWQDPVVVLQGGFTRTCIDNATNSDGTRTLPAVLLGRTCRTW